MQIANPLNLSSFAFALLGFIHLLGVLCSLGTAAAMNLRLLGVGIDSGSPNQLWRETWVVTLIGLTVAIGSGFLLFSIAPGEYYENPVFQGKLAVLLAAIAFYFTMVRRAAARDGKASVVAVISLGLYAFVPLGGILIGYE